MAAVLVAFHVGWVLCCCSRCVAARRSPGVKLERKFEASAAMIHRQKLDAPPLKSMLSTSARSSLKQEIQNRREFAEFEERENLMDDT